MSAPRLLVLGEKARRLLAAEVFDVAVLVGEETAQTIGCDFVQAAKRIAPETELVLVSQDGPGSWPPGGCLPGVYWWLAWPIDSELAVRTLRGEVERRRLRAGIEQLRAELGRRDSRLPARTMHRGG